MIPSGYEEPAPDTHADPRQLAVELAREKALDVASGHPGRIVIGADTVVALGEQLLAKPRDSDDAVRMLLCLSGREHQVTTGVVLACVREEEAVFTTFQVSTNVRFRELDEAEIRAYVATGEPMDKAGAYGIQGYGGLLIQGIRGDYNNVVGLPVTDLALALRGLGIQVLGK